MITGSGFGSFENVELQVTHLDGDPVGGEGHDPWTARSSFSGGFVTYWVVPFDDNDGEVLLLTATGLSSGFTASTTFTDAVNVNLDQLQNGNASSSPSWANGNINTSNSCYAENDAVPFRYFIDGLESGTTHYFTIQMEWTKGGIHAYDYLVSYDLTEGAQVDSAGGPCGTISTAPPGDCDATLDSFPFPNPTLTSNYSPTNPPDSFPPVFSLSSPANLKFYNASIDSLGPYFFTGSASDRELNLLVTFTVQDTGSVGFYWGGHMAHGVPGKWGSGEGSGSVSGAPYHMRTKDLDGGGGKNQDRSIQNGALCLPPQATFSCASSLLSCGNTSSSCTADDLSGNLYTWQVVGGTIDSGQGTTTIYYTATASDWVYITLEACDTTGGCPGDFCCNEFTDSVEVQPDTTDPQFVSCPGNATFQCDAVPAPPTNLTGTDNCDPSPTISYLGETTTPGACPQSYTITRRWEICDDAGNCDTCTQVITVLDSTKPVFTNCPINTTVQCYAVPPVANPTATDNCDPNPVETYLGETTTPGSCPHSYTLTRKWVATDACGNKSDTCVQIISVVDTNKPYFVNCPSNATVSCNAVPTPASPNAADSCDSNPIETYLGQTTTPGSCPQSYTITRKWIATDACGNISDTCVQILTVVDNNRPYFVDCPSNITVPCNAVPSPASPTAADSCDSNPLETYLGETSSPGSCPQSYTLTRKWVAVDACGNISDTCVQFITVIDNIKPVITNCPTDVTVQCNAIPDPPTVLATDECDPSPIVSYLGQTINPGSCPYTITRKWVAIDACGNVSDTCVQTITVNDTNPPAITCPGPVTVQCFADVPAPDVNSVSAFDSCGMVTITHEGDSPSGSCPTIITRTYKATDPCGNFAICTQIITVDDTTAPVLSGCPSDESYQCYSNVPAPANVTADDNCEGAITPMFSEQQSNPGTSCNNIITRTWTATDSCGNTAICIQTITVNDNIPPIPSGCPSNATYQCFSQVPAPANVTFNDTCSGAITPSFSESQTNPGSSCNNVITRIWTASDACGNQATCSQTITVNDNTKPTCNVPNDTTITLCAPATICLTVSATDNCDSSVVCSKLSGPGTYSGGQWCFAASTGNQTIVGIFQCTDDCNNVCVDTVNVHLVVNTAPVLSVNVSSPVTVCEAGDTICVPFTVVDPDNGLSYETLIGWVNSGPKTACFIADTTGNYCNRLIVKDSCNIADTVNYCVQVNVCPTPNLGPDSTKAFGSVCLPISGNFRLRNFSGCGPLIWKVNNVTASQDTTINYSAGYCTNFNQTWTISVMDNCGRSDSYTVTIQANVNCLPQAGCPSFIPDRPICSLNTLVCIPGDGFTCSDADGGATTTLNGQPYNPGDPICFTPNAFGPYTLTLICSDSCEADTCSSVVNIIQGDCPSGCGNVVIEKTHNTIQGQFESVDITIDSMATPIGGFDLLIEYDASALSLSQVQPGSFISGCGWEYFTYRLGGCNNCAPNACPTGAVRLIAIAEINNGPNHPDCFQMEPAQLATMIFLVTNDRTFECQYVPIRFLWCDCGDNTFSSVNGDSLYLAEHIYDYYDGISWTEITSTSAPFPTNFGPNASCDVLIGDDKPDPTRCIDFYNGGIDIVCADSIDDRGDINLNGVSNEVADAVLFGNYFVYGMGVFTVNVQGQIAATDVNADGTVLSVADLVYLIRVVIGDANPYSKLAPVNVKFNISDDGRLSVDHKTNIGAAFVMVQGQVEPKLLADQMEIKYSFDGNHTRILVWSLEGRSFTGEFLQVNGPIASIEMATAEGTPVALNTVPTEYTLNQNYPNPFNPKTNISFTLPRASDYTLTIFNVNGQEVARFSGEAESAGSFEIEWEAGNYASGIYFYRLTAGNFTDMKKMILLK